MNTLVYRVERAAAGEQGNPVEIVGLRVRAEVGVEEQRHRTRPLRVLPQLHESPALAVGHRGLADAGKRVGAFAHPGHQPHHRLVVCHRRAQGAGLVVEPIELLPHLGADLFPDLRGVFPRRTEARHHRRPECHVRGEAADGTLRIGVGGVELQPHRGQRAIPALIGRDLDPAQHQAVGRVDHPRDIVGALEVAAHPIEAVGDSGKHAFL